MAKKEISWILRARDSVSAVLGKVGKRFASFAKSGAKLAKDLAKGFMVLGAAAVAMGAKTIAAYQKQTQAEAKLTATLRATGYAAGFTTSQLKEQAAQLQKQTGIGDEVILSMQGVLATFREIKGDTFRDATEAILDMSTVMAKAGKDSADVEAAAIQVGKALNDPIRGMSALGRTGIQFNVQQREQIRVMQESGDMAGAQAVIMRELQNQFGGAAKGIDENVKSYRVLKAAFGDLQERVGEALTDNMALSDTFDGLTKKIEDLAESGYIEYWAERMAAAIRYVMDLIGPLIKALAAAKNFIAETAATAGALSTGMGWRDSREIAKETVEQLKLEKIHRLEVIRAERKAKKEAKAEEEYAEMRVARVRSELAAKADADEQRRIDAEKRRNELIEDRNKLLKEQTRILGDIETERQIKIQVANIDREINNLQNEIDRIMGRQVGKAIEDQIAERAEGMAGQKDVKRRDEAFERRRKILEERERMGRHLRGRDRDFLAQARDFDKAREQERKAAAHIEMLEREKERIQNSQLRELEKIAGKLEKNLQAAGGI